MHVILLAHGSRDPRHGATMRDLATALGADLRTTRPDVSAVTVAYLDHAEPRLPDSVRALPAGEHVVVPLLLTEAFHSRVDVPAAVSDGAALRPDVTLHLTSVIGTDPRLAATIERRAAATGAVSDDPSTAMLLMAAGSSDPAARAQVARFAEAWFASGSARGAHAFVAGAGPSIPEAVHALAERGATRIVLAPFLLAPGVLPERGAALARSAAAERGVEVLVAEPIGAAPELVAIISERITARSS